MITFKISNITNTFAKRHSYFNTNVNLIYVDGIFKKSRILSPGQTLYLNLDSLPIEIHKLRAKGLITVVEVDKNAYADQQARENIAKHKADENITDNTETSDEFSTGSTSNIKKKSVKKD